MLIPSRTKYRRVHRIKYEGKAKGNTKLSFGEYGLMAKEGAWITNNQIEAARIAMTRYIKRGGKVWIKIFPHKPVKAPPILSFQMPDSSLPVKTLTKSRQTPDS